jgi:hypothetical protein
VDELDNFSDQNTRAALAEAMDQYPTLYAQGMTDEAVAMTAMSSLKRLKKLTVLAEFEMSRIIQKLSENNLWTHYPGADAYNDLFEMLAAELELSSSETSFFRLLHEQLYPMLE